MSRVVVQKWYITGKMFCKAYPALWMTAVCVESSGSQVTSFFGGWGGRSHVTIRVDVTELEPEQELMKGQI